MILSGPLFLFPVHHILFQKFEKPFAVGFTQRNSGAICEKYLISFDVFNFSKRNDVRPMHTYEVIFRQVIFHFFHGRKSDKPACWRVDAHIVAQSFDVQNFLKAYFYNLAVHLYEDMDPALE